MPQTIQFPPAIRHGRFVHVEQDSQQDIEGAVQAVLETPLGWLESRPAMGLPDLAFITGGIPAGLVREAGERWEPRARVLTEAAFDGVLARCTVEARRA